MKIVSNIDTFVVDIKSIIERAQRKACSSINKAMIQAYWMLGRRIVEQEQGGAARAEYGKSLLKSLAAELVPLYGNSYSARRLQDYRLFYLYFSELEIWHLRMPNLTWTHFRELLTVDNKMAKKNR